MSRRAWTPLLALFAMLLAVRAEAVGFRDYQQGRSYDIHEVTEPTVRKVAKAVAYFGVGTGFIVSPDGWVLTNHHIFKMFGTFGTIQLGYVAGQRVRELDVDLVVQDRSRDMALYRIRGRHRLPYVPIRPSVPLRGEEVFVVGHPKNRPQRVSMGRVIATRVTVTGKVSIEHTAFTEAGSSGSPVCDQDGNALALHWGWDAKHTSHGQLLAIGMNRIVEHIPPVRRIATRWGSRAAGRVVAGGGPRRFRTPPGVPAPWDRKTWARPTAGSGAGSHEVREGLNDRPDDRRGAGGGGLPVGTAGSPY